MSAHDLRQRFAARRHTALLVALVSLFVIRPLCGDSELTMVFFSIVLVGLLLVALYTIQVDDLVGEREVLLAERRRRGLAGWGFAALALAERIVAIHAPSQQVYVVALLSYLLFFAFVTWCQVRSLLRHREVTGETISMSISIYLLLGLAWAFAYALILERHPGAFSYGATPPPTESQHDVLASCIYFSLTTISTIGFGDITPVALPARYAAVAEGITGQFYLAILVARLVGMHMGRVVADRERR